MIECMREQRMPGGDSAESGAIVQQFCLYACCCVCYILIVGIVLSVVVIFVPGDLQENDMTDIFGDICTKNLYKEYL